MGLHISLGSGRAKCRECKELILKTEIDIRFSGYQMEQHYHHKCIDKGVYEYKKARLH